MRQDGLVDALALKVRRAETKKAKIALFRRCAGEAAKRSFTLEKLFRIGRQIARKGRDFGLPVERFAVRRLTGGRGAQDRGQLFAAELHPRLAGGAHRGECHDVDVSSSVLSSCDSPVDG